MSVSSRPKCAHGYEVDHCPLTAVQCNFSHEYEAAKNVPPPKGAILHPKQVEWHRNEGAEWAQKDWE